MNVIGSHIESRRFCWNPNTKEFIAEIAEICHGGLDPLGQLYNDEADQGFVMISMKTRKEVQFLLHNIQRDVNRDVKFWEFHPIASAVYYNPKLQGVTVIIFND